MIDLLKEFETNSKKEQGYNPYKNDVFCMVEGVLSVELRNKEGHRSIYSIQPQINEFLKKLYNNGTVVHLLTNRSIDYVNNALRSSIDKNELFFGENKTPEIWHSSYIKDEKIGLLIKNSGDFELDNIQAVSTWDIVNNEIKDYIISSNSITAAIRPALRAV